MHPAAIAKLVLQKILCYWAPLAARAPLKDGQNIHKNTDPTMAMISELWLELLL
jgi:hypothetical protein